MSGKRETRGAYRVEIIGRDGQPLQRGTNAWEDFQRLVSAAHARLIANGRDSAARPTGKEGDGRKRTAA